MVEPLNIVWWSNAPWCPSGYGSQTNLITAELVKLGHKVAIVANFGLSDTTMTLPDGRVVFPVSGDRNGESGVEWVAAMLQADVVVGLYDVWCLDRKLWARISERWPTLFWCPVEHFPLMDAQKAFFDETSVTAVPMSKFGAKQFSEAGIEGADMIYHALDPVLSTKGDKIEFRRDANIAVSDWVVGVVAANSDLVHSRKGFPVIFEAFSKLYSKYPDTHLFLHTKAGGGMNLNRMASKYGAPLDNIHVPTPDTFYMTQPIEGLRDKYAGFDVLFSPSLGEGFGLPVIEAQAQGTPVVVNDATAQSELVGAGHAIASGFDYWDETCGSFYRYPSAESAVVHLESLRERSSEDVIADSVAARKFVRRFRLKDITGQWEHLLASVVRP